MRYSRVTAAVALLLGCSISQAFEFKSIGAAPAVLYDAPSQKGKKVFVAPRGMPVEVVLSYGDWAKVRDASGALAWLESKSLSSKRNVVVQALSAKVRSAAEEGAFIVFTAEKGVLLEMSDPVAAGWIKVRHRDGQTGYVKASEVWGE
jgi:SH3-like domain-containing protein